MLTSSGRQLPLLSFRTNQIGVLKNQHSSFFCCCRKPATFFFGSSLQKRQQASFNIKITTTSTSGIYSEKQKYTRSNNKQHEHHQLQQQNNNNDSNNYYERENNNNTNQNKTSLLDYYNNDKNNSNTNFKNSKRNLNTTITMDSSNNISRTTLEWELKNIKDIESTKHNSDPVYHAYIHLKAASTQINSSAKIEVQQHKENGATKLKNNSGSDNPIVNSSATTSSRVNDCNDSSGSNANYCVNENVLAYEQQKRKREAENKTTNILSQEQLNILYEDEHIIVVHKPSGILCVPGVNNKPSLLDTVYEYVFPQKEVAKDTDKNLEVPTLSTISTLSVQNENDDSTSAMKTPMAAAMNTTITGDNISPATTVMDENEKEATILPKDKNCMIVHRLDMDTSGIVLFGKNKAVVKKLHDIFARRENDNCGKANNNNNKRSNKNRKRKKTEDGDYDASSIFLSSPDIKKKLDKEYEALVCGHIPQNIVSGIINLPLQRNHKCIPFMRVCTPESEIEAKEFIDALRNRGWKKLTKKNPKPSQTQFHVLSREYYCSSSDKINNTSEDTIATQESVDEEKKTKKTEENDGNDIDQKMLGQQQLLPVTRLLLKPITGRTHQLRVHCAAIGYPIVGDPAYGLYGEAEMFGGIPDIDVNAFDVTNNNASKQLQQQGEGEAQISPPPPPISITRASIPLQEKIMKEYPPNEKPMCLHAKRLRVPHPITNETMEWKSPTPF